MSTPPLQQKPDRLGDTFRFLSSYTAALLVVIGTFIVLNESGQITFAELKEWLWTLAGKRGPAYPPPVPPAEAPAPPAYQPFAVFPLILRDRVAHLNEAHKFVWVTFDHLPDAEARVAVAKWPTGVLVPIDPATHLYRFTCPRDAVSGYNALTKTYPYALAPGDNTILAEVDAYRVVTHASPLRVPVVRGDWLAAHGVLSPSFRDAIGLVATQDDLDRYRREPLSPSEMKLFESHTPVPRTTSHSEWPPRPDRHWVETDAGGLGSRWVLEAQAKGVGVPVY